MFPMEQATEFGVGFPSMTAIRLGLCEQSIGYSSRELSSSPICLYPQLLATY